MLPAQPLLSTHQDFPTSNNLETLSHDHLQRGRSLVPFLVNVHTDPHDYFRYTFASLHRIFEEAGFSQIRITSMGGLFQAAFGMLFSLIRWNSIRVVVAGSAIGLDSILKRIKKGFFEERWVLMYWVEAYKGTEVVTELEKTS